MLTISAALVSDDMRQVEEISAMLPPGHMQEKLQISPVEPLIVLETVNENEHDEKVYAEQRCDWRQPRNQRPADHRQAITSEDGKK